MSVTFDVAQDLKTESRPGDRVSLSWECSIPRGKQHFTHQERQHLYPADHGPWILAAPVFDFFPL